LICLTTQCTRSLWRVLDQAHRKRNLAEYEGDIDVDEAMVTSLVEIAEEIRRAVVALTI
jgi:hypothetical protein